MKTARGYSLWFMPEGALKKQYADIIDRLAAQYTAPVFEPHVTLLGGIVDQEDSIAETSETLFQTQSPFRVSFGKLASEERYYRALHVIIDAPQELIDLEKEIKTRFNMPLELYVPHLSLLYGDFVRSETEEIAREINVPRDEWEVQSVHLWKTTGVPETWHRVREFKFKH